MEGYEGYVALDMNRSNISYANDPRDFNFFNETPPPMPPYSIETFFALDNERAIFRYCYHVFAVVIVTLNFLLLTAILVSRKQRRHFRNWLVLNMTIVHMLYGGLVCPFAGEGLKKLNAGLEIVPCKLLSFASDNLDYMSNISIGMFGIYQCLNAMSPQMLKGVSRALLTSMMIVMPWVISIMLTAYLRITMSEELYGECHKISDKTAQNLWLVLAYGIPLVLVLVCLLTMLFATCSTAITTTEATPNGRKNMTLFVIVCLSCCLVLKPPYYFGYSVPFVQRCMIDHGILLCSRLTHSLDLLRMSVFIIIPLVYLIPSEAKRLYRKLISKPLCKTVDCSANSKQNLRMVKLSTTDKTPV